VRNVVRARSSLVWKSEREGTIEVAVVDATGAPQVGQEVHFNVDRELSRQASRERGVTVELQPDTTFIDPIVPTDTSGRAASELRISAAEPAGAVIVIVLDVAGQTEVLQHRLKGQP
jgi:hypothetical protein